MAYESYDNSVNKIQNLWEKTQKNKNNIQNIKKISIKFSSITFLKKINIISLFDEIDISSGNQIVETTLLNFPDWAINMIRITPVFYLDDVYGPEGLDRPITQDFSYEIFKVDDIHYKIIFDITANATIFDPTEGTIQLPVYFDLKLTIINDRIYESI